MGQEVRSTMLDVRGTAVPCLIGGDGPPLLWLHGAGGSDTWSPAQDALAASFTVWAPAHPGFAGTPLPTWVHDVHDLAFHYADLLATAEIEQPTVVGISLGGWIATDLAVHRPDLLSRLVLVDAVGLRPAEPMPDLFIMEPAEAMAVLFGDGGPPAQPGAADVDPIDMMVRMYEEQAASARIMWKRPYDPQLERRLHHAAMPTLVVGGGQDRLLPPEYGRHLADLLPDARYEVLDGVGHVVPVQAPDAFARLVTDFALAPTGARS